MLRILSIVILALVVPASAQYEVVASESFNYPAGALGGQSGGAGWANSWFSGGSGFDASVTYPGFDGIGGKATTSGTGGSFRIPSNTACPAAVAFGLYGADDSTMWFRFRMARVAGGDDQYGGFSLFEQFVGEKLFIGCTFQATELGYASFGGAGTIQGTIPGTSCDVETWIVARIDFLPGMERLRMWVDPVDPNPLSGAVVDTMINDFLWNECRIESGAGTSMPGYCFDDLVIEVTCGELLGDVDTISASLGGTQTLTLDAGMGNAGNMYIVGGTLSGTTPGTPAGTFLVPLNFDLYTDLTVFTPTLSPLSNSQGSLDANGQATITVTIPAVGPGAVGVLAYHAGVVLDAAGITVVSNPFALFLVP